MDNRIVGAIALLGVVLVGSVGAYMMMGGDGDAPAPGIEEPAPAPGPKGEAKAAKTDAAPDAAPRPDDQPVKAAPDVERDPDWEERVEKHRQQRHAKNLEWRNKSTASAQQWVANSGLDEGTGLQVMGTVTKYHDTVAQSRADMEDGVIDPRTLREEMEMAREDIRVELENLLGAEKLEEFLQATSQGKLGGF